jgi:hypothetical protein
MGILKNLKAKYAKTSTDQDDREEQLLEQTKRAIIKEQQQQAASQPSPSPTVPLTKKQLKKHNKLRDRAMYQSLKPIYDDIYAQESVKVIKERAKRDARREYGRTKKEKRRDAVQNLIKGVSDMGDLLGGKPPQRSQPQRKKGQGRKGQARKRKDPFDFDMDFDFDFKL